MVELKNKIYWVGAIDYNIRDFHGYNTPCGTTYNAYLIIDEKITLVDTVKKGFGPDLVNNIKEIIPPEKIDYIIVNHVEPDHSGSLPELLSVAKNARIFCTQKGKEGLIKHYGLGGADFNIIKTGDSLSLGKRTLRFIAAPMVHWPDSMFTYCQEDKVLLPNDAFGQHIASPKRFADELGQDRCMEEAAKYYANILMPLGSVIAKKIEEFLSFDLPVEIIAPSHGAIWRKDVLDIVNAYMGWTSFRSRQKVVIAYDTMWNSTDILARRLSQFISEEGVEVKLYNIRKSDVSELVRDILDASVILIGSPTLNADMFWTVGGFLTYLRGLKPKNKKVGIFGSFGWAEAASKAIKKEFETMGLEIIEPPFEVQYVPTEEELSKLKEYAKVIVAKSKV
ncbi:MAG TPA: FprA family A-type flavoprotein [Candidatus Omnitrophota bacterium]|nr:FprA family A-type flavoprotein [Candidatus Omnitrophota bacterium]